MVFLGAALRALASLMTGGALALGVVAVVCIYGVCKWLRGGTMEKKRAGCQFSVQKGSPFNEFHLLRFPLSSLFWVLFSF